MISNLIHDINIKKRERVKKRQIYIAIAQLYRKIINIIIKIYIKNYIIIISNNNNNNINNLSYHKFIDALIRCKRRKLMTICSHL